jgi:RNA polymerase sigma-70 factor (ECF subfamily)
VHSDIGPPGIRDEYSNEALIERVCDGDREALGQLFRRFAEPIRWIGRRVLRDSSEADDVVQEVFFYIQRKCGHFDRSKGPARSWIVQIAYTQAFLRRRKLRASGFYLSAIPDRTLQSDSGRNSGAEYDHTVEGLFGQNGWRNAVGALTEEQRETLRLHFFEGYTFAEIADKLGQSYGNVRNHYYRGLEKLRKHLAQVQSGKA